MVVKVDPRAENLDKLFLIYADIETESLRKLKILQIAAVTQDGDTFCNFTSIIGLLKALSHLLNLFKASTSVVEGKALPSR